MKKLLGILVLGLLFSGNAYACLKEPGTDKKCYKIALKEFEEVKKIIKEAL